MSSPKKESALRLCPGGGFVPVYTCDKCNCEFETQGWLDWHMKRQHYDAPARPSSSSSNILLYCSYCQFTTKSTTSLRVHVSRYHEAELASKKVTTNETEAECNYRLYQEPLAARGYSKCPTCSIYYHPARSASHPNPGVCLNV